jgi:hypothetical protein
MDSVAQPPHTINVPVGLLVLEDEDEVSKNLKFKLGESLESNRCISLHPGNVEPTFMIAPTITVANNIKAANQLVISGKYDVLLADIMVYREEAGVCSGMVSCLPLLKDIAIQKLSISTIGHSAYPEYFEEAKVNGWMLESVSKSDRNSIQKVVEKSVKWALETARYRASLRLGLEELKNAIKAESPVDRESSLVATREIFSCLQAPTNLPEEYRKALATFVPLLYRHSTIPSEKFNLLSFSSEFTEVVEPFLAALESPLFDYEKDAFPVFCKLDALGYQVTMRLDINEKELIDDESSFEQ